MPTRLNKFLAERGVCSRRQADALIDEGKVTINGEIAQKGIQVDEMDEVFVMGKRVESERPEFVYLAFHKPVGIMTSVDPLAHDTIRTFLNLENHIFPIGRLDVASSGLLLLTNDGDLAERITHPRFQHEKEYLVRVDDPISDEDLETMATGMMILGSMTKPAIVRRQDDFTFQIILTEGRNRQIRRMCEQLGHTVNYLKRVRIMNIKLGQLPKGAVRPLRRGELIELKNLLNMR